MSDIIRTYSFAPAQAQPRARRVSPIAALWGTVATAMRVAITRRQLADVDDRTLQDLGISRAQANFEAQRAPWDLGSAR